MKFWHHKHNNCTFLHELTRCDLLSGFSVWKIYHKVNNTSGYLFFPFMDFQIPPISLRMNIWSVEHFLDISFIKLRFSCNQNIGETFFKLNELLSNLNKTFFTEIYCTSLVSWPWKDVASNTYSIIQLINTYFFLICHDL